MGIAESMLEHLLGRSCTLKGDLDHKEFNLINGFNHSRFLNMMAFWKVFQMSRDGPSEMGRALFSGATFILFQSPSSLSDAW